METKDNATTKEQPDTKKVIIIEIAEDELNNLKAECEKLRNENAKLREDLTISKSLYNYECEQNRTLTAKVEAIKNIINI
jgi:cell shape-determining protein MreC